MVETYTHTHAQTGATVFGTIPAEHRFISSWERKWIVLPYIQSMIFAIKNNTTTTTATALILSLDEGETINDIRAALHLYRGGGTLVSFPLEPRANEVGEKRKKNLFSSRRAGRRHRRPRHSHLSLSFGTESTL